MIRAFARWAVVLAPLAGCGRVGFQPADRSDIDAAVRPDAPADAAPVAEAVGELDPTFGTGGEVLVMLGTGDGGAYDVIERPGGYLAFGNLKDALDASRWHLHAWTTSGQPDESFVARGSLLVDSPTLQDFGYGLRRRADGKLWLVGDAFVSGTGDDVMVGLLDGTSLATTFDGDGLRYADVANYDTGYKVVDTGDGLVACGVANRNNADTHFLLAKLADDGTTDRDFGNAGMVVDDFGVDDDWCWDAKPASGGRIVAAGTSDGQLLVVRYHADGQPDSAFGTSGVWRANLDASGEGHAMAITAEEDILVVGYNGIAGVVARLASDGALRTEFGNGGMIQISTTSESTFMRDVLVQPNGKIVIAGVSEATTNVDAVIWRLMANGAPDTSFGTNGRIIIDRSADDQLYAIIQDASGNLVAAGRRLEGTLRRPWLVRLR